MPLTIRPEHVYDIDIATAAQYIGRPVKSVYKMVANREIDHLRSCDKLATRVVAGSSQTMRISGRITFCQAGLDAWIAAHRVTVAPPIASAPAAAPAKPVSLPMPARRRFSR